MTKRLPPSSATAPIGSVVLEKSRFCRYLVSEELAIEPAFERSSLLAPGQIIVNVNLTETSRDPHTLLVVHGPVTNRPRRRAYWPGRPSRSLNGRLYPPSHPPDDPHLVRDHAAVFRRRAVRPRR